MDAASGRHAVRALVACAALAIAGSGCGSGSQSVSATGQPQRASVPADFDPVAFAALDQARYWLLGELPCRSGWCLALVRTADGGRTFTRMTAPPLPAEGDTPALLFADGQDGFAFVPGPDGRLFTTHDGGETWQRRRVGDVLAVATGGGNAYVVTARCSLDRCVGYRLGRSTASSASWRWTGLPFQPDSSIVRLAALGPSVWLLATPAEGSRSEHNQLARSTDSGRAFTTGQGPCFPDLGGDLFPATSQTVWAVCPSGMLGSAFRSTDGGITFSHLSTPTLTNGAQLAPASADTAVVFGNGAGLLLVRTADGGATWAPARVPQSPVSMLEIGFTDAKHGLALVQTARGAAARPTRQALWRTRDGGATWAAVPLR